MKLSCELVLGFLSVVATGIGMAQSSPAVSEMILHDFTSPAKGANPYSRLIGDGSGNLYGTAPGGGLHGAGVVFKIRANGSATVLYNFTGGADGATPFAGVILDASGNLYGTAFQGGVSNQGVVYKLDTAGNETVLYHFKGGVDGGSPHSVLTRDPLGNLYGTTEFGGSGFAGVVFKVTGAGEETVIHSFQVGSDGANPIAGVTLDSAGRLYGTTQSGGASFQGIVYALDSKGTEKILHSFTGGADGGNPYAGVIVDPSGNLYGTAVFGGANFGGVVYKLSPSGEETVLHNFTQLSDGGEPYGGLIRDSGGNLYGTTASGGNTFNGVVYKIDLDGVETVLYNFPGAMGGSAPHAGVTRDSAGNLYGTTISGGVGYGVVYKVSAAHDGNVLFAFPGVTDGFLPFSTVIRDAQGNLYGTTSSGGATANGTIYEVSATNAEKVLYSFAGGADGATPYAGVVRDSKGNFYGTTVSGGTGNQGVVYKLDAAGHESVFHTFTGGDDGSTPYSAVTLDQAGNIYGTTAFGGANFGGVVYKIDSAGVETVIHSFGGTSDGVYPYAGVTLDPAGNIYGTTSEGGKGVGIVYKVDTNGKETVLYSFTGAADGGFPESAVTLDAQGNIYGTTQVGGVGFGVVYKLDPSGMETVLHTFTDGPDGGEPFYSPVIRDTEGNLYGTTQQGGVNNYGVVYRIDQAGIETVLYNFDSTDGANPLAGIIGSSSGDLYGTTSAGGSNGAGVVFEIRKGAGSATFE